MSYINQIRDLIKETRPEFSSLKPSEWSELNRVMTSDVSPRPGKFSYEYTPYLREPIDCLSQDHPARHITIMKGAQIGFSAGVVENGIGWLISQSPCNIILAARDMELAKIMMEGKMEQMIDSTGIRPLLRSTSKKKNNSSTGDTTTSKQFPGGNLYAFSVKNPGKMRQISAQVMFLDDFEAAEVDKDAGSPDKLFETRIKAFYEKSKSFYISTPETKQSSHIEPLYLKGDQRKYMVPCENCGDYIELVWRMKTSEGDTAGIVWKLDKNGLLIPSSVEYKCQSCGSTFKDNRKKQMLNEGKWTPTATPISKDRVSYHISTLYSPPGMQPWHGMVQDYLDACPPDGAINHSAYKTFVTASLGLTWEEKTVKVDAKVLTKNARDYEIGVAPNSLSNEDGNGSIVMITIAADLGGTLDDARVDLEITAWSENGSSYSIDHESIGTFVGRRNTRKGYDDVEPWNYHFGNDKSVWNRMEEVITTPIPSDTGGSFEIGLTGVDSGQFTKQVEAFVTLMRNKGIRIVSLKGKDVDKKVSTEKDAKLYKKSVRDPNLYLVEGDYAKDAVNNCMQLRHVSDKQPDGFMNFPLPNGKKYTYQDYFQQYEAEERKLIESKAGTKVFKWVKIGARDNHFFDCRVYNYVLKDILAHSFCKDSKITESWENFVSLLKYKK